MLKTIAANKEIGHQLAAIDHEFKDYLASLTFRKVFDVNKMATFSPLESVSSFEQKGLQQVREVSVQEMMNHGDGMQKLLANMLAHCKPGHLSDDDIDQLSGINGREINASL